MLNLTKDFLKVDEFKQHLNQKHCESPLIDPKLSGAILAAEVHVRSLHDPSFSGNSNRIIDLTQTIHHSDKDPQNSFASRLLEIEY